MNRQNLPPGPPGPQGQQNMKGPRGQQITQRGNGQKKRNTQQLGNPNTQQQGLNGKQQVGPNRQKKQGLQNNKQGTQQRGNQNKQQRGQQNNKQGTQQESQLKKIFTNKLTYIIAIIIAIILVVVFTTGKKSTKKSENTNQSAPQTANMSTNNASAPEEPEEPEQVETYLTSPCENVNGFYVNAETGDQSELEIQENVTPEEACEYDDTCDMFLKTTEGKYKKFTNLQNNLLLFCESGDNPRSHKWIGNVKKQFKDKVIVFPDTRIFQTTGISQTNPVNFDFPVVQTRFIRIYPLTWNAHMTLRFDVIDNGVVQSNPESSRTYSTIWGSNESKKSQHSQSMLDSPQGWSAATNNVGQWAQIDLGSVKSVSGVQIQARAIQESNHNQYIKTFCLHTSTYGEVWDQIKGNSDELVQPN